MSNYRISVDEIKSAARGREVEILEHVAGISPDVLDGKGHPCPLCGGTDRFSLVDRDAGAVLCRRCFDKKNGDFLAAIAWARNVTFSQACKLAGVYLSVGTNAKPATDLCKSKQAKLKTNPTAAAAVAALEQKLGPRSASWTYHNLAGEPVGLIVRWNRPDGGKDIRPVSKHADGWQIGGMPEPRPLYRLSTLPGAETVLVCEGEKTTDAAVSLGFIATTSPHGSQSAAKADWSPLAGKPVVIVPDCDDSGEMYAVEVAEILTKLSPPARVQIVRLPELNEGDDLVEWVTAGGTKDKLQLLIDAAPLIQSTNEPKPAQFAMYQPFPTALLPSPISGFVTAGAKAIGCDDAYIALPVLCTLAEAIGNRRTIRLKRTWQEHAILWGAIVGKSGQHKTPAQNLAIKSLQQRQAAAVAEWKLAQEKHEQAVALYERNYAEWKRKKSDEPPPWKPEPPVCRRFIVEDTTIEALADRLELQPDGVLVVRDELASWLDGMAEYKGGKGSDTGHWLAAWSANPWIVDRKSGRKPTLIIPRASVSIIGGIQPAILRRAIGHEHRHDGLCARLLFVMPPSRPVRWTEATVSPEAEQAIENVIGQLLTLEPAADAEGLPIPFAIPLAPDAKRIWIAYYDRHRREQADLDDDLSAAWSKLEAYTARFALIIQLARWAAGTAGDDTIDAESMTAAIGLSDWFANEARRVYGLFGASDEEDDVRKLIDYIHRRGGSATAREVQQGCRWLKNKGYAEAALESLAKSGQGKWENSPLGHRGQPTRVFRLYTASTVYGNANNHEENAITVDVDAPDADDNEVIEWKG